MRIKIIRAHEAQVLGGENPWTLNPGEILEGEMNDSKNDPNGMDIVLYDGTTLLSIPVTCFDYSPVAF